MLTGKFLNGGTFFGLLIFPSFLCWLIMTMYLNYSRILKNKIELQKMKNIKMKLCENIHENMNKDKSGNNNENIQTNMHEKNYGVNMNKNEIENRNKNENEKNVDIENVEVYSHINEIIDKKTIEKKHLNLNVHQISVRNDNDIFTLNPSSPLDDNIDDVYFKYDENDMAKSNNDGNSNIDKQNDDTVLYIKNSSNNYDSNDNENILNTENLQKKILEISSMSQYGYTDTIEIVSLPVVVFPLFVLLIVLEFIGMYVRICVIIFT
jgi:hypothetical protein